MVRIRKVNDIILSSLDFYRSAQPRLDTKPGTISRDILVDGPSAQIARLYEELARIKDSQSIRTALGVDLDRLGANFGKSRKQGSKASGSALVTFNEIDADIPISRGDIVTANNGATFTVTTNTTVAANNINVYRATASKFRSDLDFVGITDQYAVEVSVEATAIGRLGNVSKYSLATISTPGASNVTNASSFGGGTDAQDDAAFRSDILGAFGGAAAGTEEGYRQKAREDNAVLDAIVVGPGNTLMTRDGTQVFTAEDGTQTIVSEGTGGKVDIYIFGIRLVEILDSYIYRDQSNTGDPTNTANDFVLGQIEADEGKTVARKRLDNLQTGVLPNQPVNDIIEVSGSSSGSNFIAKSTDTLGRVTGNYELVRDTGAFAGSPWSFDKLRWIDDRIRDFNESQTKGRFNGQDALSFSDVTRVGTITQDITVVNENSRVSSNDRASIQLSHSPVVTVSRVFNLTTGERYVVSSQNPDGDGSLNETGRITISGNTLPATSDTLQVDYTWRLEYDPNFDYDNIDKSSNPRSAVDSVDWGFNNAVRREQQNVVVNGSQKTVTVTHPITSVISVNTFVSEVSTVTLVQGRLAVVVSNTVANVVSIEKVSDGAELFDTSNNDGSISGLTIFLPTDTVGAVGNSVTVIYNAEDVYTSDGISGSFNGNVITFSQSASVTAGTIVECNYIANVRTILSTTLLPALPAVRNGNAFNTTSQNNIGTQPYTFVFSGNVVEQNLRLSPARLGLTIAGNISAGVITVSGTTFSGVFDGVFTVGTAGLTQNLSSLVKNAIGISSSSSISSNYEVVRVISCSKVTATDSNDVLSVDHDYDIKGYELRNNTFVKEEVVVDPTLSITEFTLPSTEGNIDETPEVGDKLQVTFYIANTDASENVSFSKSGTLYTDNIFAIVDTIAISSGFTSGDSQTASLSITAQNQPQAGTRYNVAYDYIAPKSNERISIRYNENKLVTDTTLNIEEVRTISSDVLVKAASPILIDATLNIVVSQGFESSSTLVQQNVQDAVTSALNATDLGTIVDASDLIEVAYTVDGVDRIRVMYFNINGLNGSALSIEAEDNEYLQANIVTVNVETR